MPKTISQYQSYTINNSYTATGVKVASKYTQSGSATTYYIGPFVYKDNTLDYVINSESRAVYSNGTFSYYEYHLKDHLGNIRYAFKLSYGNASALQINDYYPFGMLMKPEYNTAANKNKYLYNGKELYHGNNTPQTANLDWYDYGARMYDPQLGRWHSIDPMAEKTYNWTPYRYGFDNPINNIDIGGKFELMNASQYPALTNLLQGAIQGILSDPKIMKSLQYYGDLKATTIKNDVKWGQGPKIWVRQLLSTGLYQGGKYPDRLQIDAGFVAALEKAAKSGNLGQYRAEILEIIAIILHEYVHYGDFIDDGKSKDEGLPLEDDLGYQFEEAAFGKKLFDTPDAKAVLDNNESKDQSNNNSGGSNNNSSLISQIKNLPPGKYKVVNGQIVPDK